MKNGRDDDVKQISKPLAPVTEIVRKLYDADSCLSSPLSPSSNEPRVSQDEATRDFAFPFADSTPAHLQNLRITILVCYNFSDTFINLQFTFNTNAQKLPSKLTRRSSPVIDL